MHKRHSVVMRNPRIATRTVRLETPLYDRVEKLAEKQRRSVSQQVAEIVEFYFHFHEREKAADAGS